VLPVQVVTLEMLEVILISLMVEHIEVQKVDKEVIQQVTQ
jgi:hypothetical protein